MNAETYRDFERDDFPFYCLPAPKSTIRKFRIDKVVGLPCMLLFRAHDSVRSVFKTMDNPFSITSDSSSLSTDYYGKETDTTQHYQSSVKLSTEWITDESIYDSMIENDITISMRPVNEFKVELKIKEVVKASPKIYDFLET
jgi:hypothetical protein